MPCGEHASNHENGSRERSLEEDVIME